MSRTFFITTAIDYTNGAPHIGHAYEKVLADVIARYQRMKGSAVFYLTGVDQHGQKVQQSAEKAGIAPQEYVDGITAKFRALWEKLDIRYDGWAATTDQLHKDCVRAILQKLWDDRDAGGSSRWIYKKTQRGFYSVRQEQFLTDKERGEDGQFGPEWGLVEEREEENYYFRLTKGGALDFDPKQWLLNFIDARSEAKNSFVVPDFRVSELRNAVEKLDGDLCISRPKSRLSWGIEIPFDPDFVTFVWFDALVNYISFADYSTQAPNAEFSARWPAVHVIGKDILIPAHGVYWPIMLKALGFTDEEMPTLLVHGWWNIRGKGGESEKMSKSLGNVVDPDVLADKYGAEALRYYLMSDISTGRDADFSEERLIQRYNTELANSLGNLLNRTLNMAQKYREGTLQIESDFHSLVSQLAAGEEVEEKLPSGVAFEDRDQSSPKYRVKLAAFHSGGHAFHCYTKEMEECQVSNALSTASGVATACNSLIDLTAPWKLAKDPEQAEHLNAVLYHLAESLRIIAILISPVMPKAAAGIFEQLNWDGPMTLAEAEWGKLPDGHQLGKPTPLFPRIELPKPTE
ncbi:MAG: methionine--tRNA ligase [Chthoniobacteraceae bacterium]